MLMAKGPITAGGQVIAGQMHSKGPITTGTVAGSVSAKGPVIAGNISGPVAANTVINAGGGGAATGAPAAGAARMARMPADRPAPVAIENVRVQSAPLSIARTPQTSPPLPEPSPAPTTGATAARLAASTGGTIARSYDGAATVSFPPPPELPAEPPAAPMIQRAEGPAPSTSSTSAPGAPGAPPASGDIQELAEKVIEVMKREALIERERRGDLI
jgi:hypothetical protein